MVVCHCLSFSNQLTHCLCGGTLQQVCPLYCTVASAVSVQCMRHRCCVQCFWSGQVTVSCCHRCCVYTLRANGLVLQGLKQHLLTHALCWYMQMCCHTCGIVLCRFAGEPPLPHAGVPWLWFWRPSTLAVRLQPGSCARQELLDPLGSLANCLQDRFTLFQWCVLGQVCYRQGCMCVVPTYRAGRLASSPSQQQSPDL